MLGRLSLRDMDDSGIPFGLPFLAEASTGPLEGRG